MNKLIIFFVALSMTLSSFCADAPITVTRSPYAERYMILKRSFKLDKENLSERQVAEAIDVKFADILDKTTDALEKLTLRMGVLETENKDLKFRLVEAEKKIKSLEERAALVDKDLDKLFTWVNKADDDLYAVGGKIERLDDRVKRDCQKLSTQIENVQKGVRANANEIVNEIKRLWMAIPRR